LNLPALPIALDTPGIQSNSCRAKPKPRGEADANNSEHVVTYWVWLIIAGVFAIIEVRSLAFYALFAAIGAAAASLASAVTNAIGIQVAVFAAVSLLGVVFVRRMVTGALSSGSRPALVSGAAGLVGQHATVVRQVRGPHDPGTVHTRGEDWPAISYEESPLEPGEVVVVVELDRTRLVVMSI
jgi:membrane protein implicated in regulation of membrane protease activity